MCADSRDLGHRRDWPGQFLMITPENYFKMAINPLRNRKNRMAIAMLTSQYLRTYFHSSFSLKASTSSRSCFWRCLLSSDFLCWPLFLDKRVLFNPSCRGALCFCGLFFEDIPLDNHAQCFFVVRFIKDVRTRLGATRERIHKCLAEPLMGVTTFVVVDFEFLQFCVGDFRGHTTYLS